MKSKKVIRIPKSKGRTCCNIITGLILCLLIQPSIAIRFPYEKGVVLTSTIALMGFIIDYCWTKKICRDFLTKEQYRRYLKYQVILWIIILGLLLIVNWLVRMGI